MHVSMCVRVYGCMCECVCVCDEYVYMQERPTVQYSTERHLHLQQHVVFRISEISYQLHHQGCVH